MVHIFAGYLVALFGWGGWWWWVSGLAVLGFLPGVLPGVGWCVGV